MTSAVIDQLIAAGVSERRIEVSPVDTSVDSRYYSQRLQATQSTTSHAERILTVGGLLSLICTFIVVMVKWAQ